jgi:hypothetical protein
LLLLTLPLALKAWKVTTDKERYWRFRAPPLFFGMAFFTELLFVGAVAIIYFLKIGSLF